VSLYDAIGRLELAVDEFRTERREAKVSSDFTRVTTTVVLAGAGHTGEGEDVTYDAAAHDDVPELHERGTTTLDGFSQALEAYGFLDYRRWAFESAALSLALRQNGLTLGAALGRSYAPVRFVVSTRLEIGPWLELYPQMEFKLDPVSEWSDDRMREIAATGRVRVLDLKGHYRGTAVDAPPDPRLYRAVAEIFPEAIIEDAALTPETREALRGAEDRLSWDAPIHGVDDILALELEPRYVNIKPSRFGPLRRLFDAVDHCEERGIRMYGGGQFELGCGRGHIQALASLFYPGAANDVAPKEYNEGGARPGLPESPLELEPPPL
jgi:hypothetical protein